VSRITLILSGSPTQLQSGVRATFFSTNGTEFLPYTGPFVISPYQAPVIYAFSDDNAGNRSSLSILRLVDVGVPVLVTQANSTRGVALDSILRTTEPFPISYEHLWGTDVRTRISLFALNFELAASENSSAITATAEDVSHRFYPLTVEFVGKVPGFPSLNSVVVRLSDEMDDLGDVLIRIAYHGVSSNAVRVGIGHIGGGPVDPAAHLFSSQSSPAPLNVWKKGYRKKPSKSLRHQPFPNTH
jgi:hypothetical protein